MHLNLAEAGGISRWRMQCDTDTGEGAGGSPCTAARHRAPPDWLSSGVGRTERAYATEYGEGVLDDTAWAWCLVVARGVQHGGGAFSCLDMLSCR